MSATTRTRNGAATNKGKTTMRSPTFAISKFSGLIFLAITLGACVATTGSQPSATTASTAAAAPSTEIQLAIAARSGGDYASAIRMLRRHLASNPLDTEAALELGDTLHEASAYDEAIEVYTHARKFAPGNLEALSGLGRAELALRRPAPALGHFGKVLEIEPDNIIALNGSGVAYDLQGDHPKAQEAYTAALALRPNNHLVEANLALSYLLQDRYNDAIEILERLSLDNSSTVRTRQNLALAYGLRGDADIAAEIARIDLDPEMVENNLRYYEIIRGVDAPQLRSAPLVSR